ncbi:MAG: GAF domain-containing protein [Pseudanabaena sp. RU_4_16]|nr:GAF domain-containing protein [Pseudanabaena sp. RU_4_16]
MHRLKTDTEHKVWIVVGNQDYLIYSELLKSDRRDRYQIKQYESALEALTVLEVFPQETPDCILLDWELPDLNREEFLQQLNTDRIPAIVLARQKSEEIVALAAQDYLVKETLTKELLCRTVGYAIAQVELQQKLAEAETKLQKYQLAEQELKQPEIHKPKTYPEQAVNLLLQSIHSSFDLSTIFIAATTAIGKLLQLDRVEIIQYLPDRGIWISIAEYQDRDRTAILSTLGTEISDRDDELFFRLKQGELVCINRSTEVNSNVSRALVEASSSYIIVPLVVGSGIWGLLSLECTGRERYWQDLEIDLASNIATQLGVAIQQSLFFRNCRRNSKSANGLN